MKIINVNTGLDCSLALFMVEKGLSLSIFKKSRITDYVLSGSFKGLVQFFELDRSSLAKMVIKSIEEKAK